LEAIHERDEGYVRPILLGDDAAHTGVLYPRNASQRRLHEKSTRHDDYASLEQSEALRAAAMPSSRRARATAHRMASTIFPLFPHALLSIDGRHDTDGRLS